MKRSHLYIGAAVALAAAIPFAHPYQAPQQVVFTAHCISQNGLPDPICTPGDTDPAVTQDNIQQTICVSGYSKTVRPPVSVTGPMKETVGKEYALTIPMNVVEGDHLISIELGGCPGPNRGCQFQSNFWDEPWCSFTDTCSFTDQKATDFSYMGAKAKDCIENCLHKRVCSGQMQLADAQQGIAANWTQYFDSCGCR